MYQNVIFDYGNTLAAYIERDIARRFVPDEADAALFGEVFFDRLYFDRLDDGSITNEEWFAAAAKRLPDRLHPVMKAAADGWYRTLPDIPGMGAVVARLRAAGRGLYLLSNISREFAANAHELPILQGFHGMVMSGPLGIVKPERGIYEHLLQAYHLDPATCVFVDDRAINIEGARAAGIAGYLFDGNASRLMDFLFS
ncbi:MAG: HAD family phosphatase [Clostridia bacterium]|nr:HAD family phosphatase [Clostridia bacterium]